MKAFWLGLLGGLCGFVAMALADQYIGWNQNTNLNTIPGNWVSAGPVQAMSGCSVSAVKGGTAAGQFTSGTTGTCTVTFTDSPAPNGYTCVVADMSAPTYAVLMRQTATSTTGCTVSGTTTSGDQMVFIMIGY